MDDGDEQSMMEEDTQQGASQAPSVRSALKSAVESAFGNSYQAENAIDPKAKHVDWDESNLREHEQSVLRGEYGTMKIEEPKTPYARPASPAGSEELGDFSLGMAASTAMSSELPAEVDSEDDPEHMETGELNEMMDAGPGSNCLDSEIDDRSDDNKKQRNFQQKRKSHYNMKEAILRARQLMEDEDEDEEYEGDGTGEQDIVH